MLQLAAPPRASVDGVVVKLGSGEPLAAAKVQLHPAKVYGTIDDFPGTRDFLNRELRQLKPEEFHLYNATTGADGKFSFKDVVPGLYRLFATRSGGYVPSEYGQRSPTGEGIPLEITAG